MSRDRRQDLVLAAFDCIAERGLEGMRMRDIALRAGLDHSTLHHHFRGKHELTAAVIRYATNEFRQTMPADATPAQRLGGHLRMLAKMIEHRPRLFAVLAEFDSRARRDPAVREVIDRQEQGWRRALTSLLGASDWDGRTVDPVPTTELIIAAVKGAGLIPHQADSALAQLADLLGIPYQRGNHHEKLDKASLA